MSKAFASQADLADKKITFEQLSPHCWAYTAEGDPNSGVIIGDRFIMVSDATATPAMAQDLIKKIRTVSDKPIKYVLLTHYHAVRVLGAYAYAAEGATEIIASQGTLELIKERGAQDMKSEMERFPRLFRNAETVPGRGEAMKGRANVNKALDYTKRWVEMLYRCGQEAVAAGMDLKAAMAHTRKIMDPVFGHVFIYEHCLPFDVSRAYDEAQGIKNPRIWTAERDKEMWAALQA